MVERRFDVVVYGASSFVGQILVRYYLETYGVDGELRWAVAGRSASKLKSICAHMGALQVPVLTADASDDAALAELCSSTKVLISTVGPYELYGDGVLKACAENGTHYADLTGEVRWINRMCKQYEAVARTSGARLVHSCGFDSLPSDMGVWFLQQRAKAKLGTYCRRVSMRVESAEGSFSGGTVATMLNEARFAESNPAAMLEASDPFALCPKEERSPSTHHRVSGAEFDVHLGKWIMPFMMAPINEPVVYRSHSLAGLPYGRDFTYNEAIVTAPGYAGLLIATCASAVGNLFAKLVGKRWWREHFLVHILPKPGQGPSVAAQEKGFYRLRFDGFTAQGAQISACVTGDRDPGYGSTAKMLGECGVCLARDLVVADLPGGSWTPASCFDDRLIERLQQHAGMRFEVVN